MLNRAMRPFAVLALVMAAVLGLTACGGKSETKSTATVTAASDCPTDNTKKFAKTRFVADIGGAYWMFKNGIYDQYQAGKFEKGAKGRVFAIGRAAVQGGVALKLLKNARSNALADPTLCKAVGQPLDKAIDALDGLKGKLMSGDLASVTSLSGIFGTLTAGGLPGGIDKILPTKP